MRKILVISIIICISFLNACIRIDTGKKETKEEGFKGIITEIYDDENQHYMKTFKIQSNKDIITENAEIWPKSWQYANLGDSIIKPSDTLILIIKKNDTTQKVFTYKF